MNNLTWANNTCGKILLNLLNPATDGPNANSVVEFGAKNDSMDVDGTDEA